MIIETINNRIAHEQSARTVGNQTDAEAFAAKITQLLSEQKLSMSESEIEKEEADEPLRQEDIDRPKGHWTGILADAVASAILCRLLMVGSSVFPFI